MMRDGEAFNDNDSSHFVDLAEKKMKDITELIASYLEKETIRRSAGQREYILQQKMMPRRQGRRRRRRTDVARSGSHGNPT